MARLAVVGGGWAGIAAAVEATRLGHAVTLFEMAPQLGGRARGVTAGGLRVDNGQHILIGAYVETLKLVRELGVDLDTAFLRMPLQLVYPDGGGLRLGRGPAALAFARAVLGQRGWPLFERVRLLRAATGWVLGGFRCDPALTVAALTRELPQRARGELIDPLCVAALNTPAAEASAQVFLRVLKDALFSGRGSADLMLPKVELGALLPKPAAAWLAARGATVRLGRRTGTIAAAGGRWSVDHDEFDRVILACPPTEAARLAREAAPAWSAIAASLRYEPIVTVYLRSPNRRLPLPMLALRDDEMSPAQYVFDRGRLGGPDGLLAFVISGAARWVERGAADTEAAVRRQARAALGEGFDEPAVTLTEKRATFRCTPGLVRPPAVIAPGLFAAGDHVEGPYPATLEGAVRSGLSAARRA